MIDWNAPIAFCDNSGREFVAAFDSGNAEFPKYVVYRSALGFLFSVYMTIDGRSKNRTKLLRNPPEKRRAREVWVNCYDDGSVNVYPTRATADHGAATDREACLKITIPEYTVGEGL